MTLSQTELRLRSSVLSVVYYISNTNPTTANDRNQGVIIGNRWINTVSPEEFVCTSNEPDNAVWTSTTSGGGSGGVSTHIATADPTSSSDTTLGLVVGQIWLNTTLKTVFIANSVATGAAIWNRIDTTVSCTFHSDTTDPVVGNDNTQNYKIGSVWINTTSTHIFIATSVATGAAVWVALDNRATNSSAHTAAVSPIASNDNTQGYVVGNMWVNTATYNVYVATDVSTGAAIWLNLASGGSITAASVSAVPAVNNSGTNVQTQLNNINSAIANVFFMGRLLGLSVIADVVINLVPYYVMKPRYVQPDIFNGVPLEVSQSYIALLTKKPTIVSMGTIQAVPLLTIAVAAKKPTVVASYTTVAL